MKLSTIYSKIKCFFGRHNWVYDHGKELVDVLDYSITINRVSPVLFSEERRLCTRFCDNCCKKQKREIVDYGRTILWVNTNRYSKQELREINLRELLE